MAGFEKIMLATGESRAEYIQRRLKEDIEPSDIAKEINSPGMYSGLPGKSWPASVVYAEKRKMKVAEDKAAASGGAEGVEAVTLALRDAVPAEVSGILDAEDVKEVYKEAAETLRKKERAKARKELLAKVTAELEHEARLAVQRGISKGDMVNVHINLAPYAPDIRLDGRVFEHGRTYLVPRTVFNVIAEQMQRSWQHENSTKGTNENAYRRPRNASISMRTGQMTGTQGLRT